MSSPRLLRKLTKLRTFRIMILGQSGVGKTALTVRFITRRFIGEYDPTLEKKYRHTTDVDDESATFDILDTAGQEEVTVRMEENIRWADAFLLVYDICDVCSFAECTRLKFLIQYSKKPRRQCSNAEPLVFLIGNKCDLQYDRMISTEEGRKKSKTLDCAEFYEISVRESCDDVTAVFHELYRQGRDLRRPWLSRSSSSQRTLSADDPGGPDMSYLSLEEPDKGVKRKTSVSQRIIRAVLPSNRSKQDDRSIEDGAYAESS